MPTPPYLNNMYGSSIPTIGGGNYYNPFYAQQQFEARQKQQRELFEEQVKLWKMMSTAYYHYNGMEVPKEVKEGLDRRFDINRYRNQRKDDGFFDELANIYQQAQQQEANYQQMMQRREEEFTKAYNSKGEYDDMTAYEWLSGPMTDRHIWAIEQESIQQQRKNVANLYDPNSYNRLLGIHESSFKSLNPSVNIDDMEIGLPEGLRNADRMKRRQAFLDSIMKTDKRW